MRRDFDTPIEHIEDRGPAHIYMKRDDLIGGSKVRIAAELLEDMSREGADYVISYGSSSSNLVRAVSETAKELGIPRAAVIKRTGPEISLNEKLARKAGARIVYTAPEAVRETIESLIGELGEEGFKPYYVYGSSLGEGREEVLCRAYEKAYREILRWEEAHDIFFDHIYIAVGTGASIGGLVLGASEDPEAPVIHGISIARNLEDASRSLTRKLGGRGQAGYILTDRYLAGGYGFYTGEMAAEIRRMYHDYQIALDPIYSGKAWFGMLRETKGQNGRILFVHTGGGPIFAENAPKLNIEIKNQSEM